VFFTGFPILITPSVFSNVYLINIGNIPVSSEKHKHKHKNKNTNKKTKIQTQTQKQKYKHKTKNKNTNTNTKTKIQTQTQKPILITPSVFSNVYLINIGNIPVVYNII
jgi:uncharacterized membrane protein